MSNHFFRICLHHIIVLLRVGGLNSNLTNEVSLKVAAITFEYLMHLHYLNFKLLRAKDSNKVCDKIPS